MSYLDQSRAGEADINGRRAKLSKSGGAKPPKLPARTTGSVVSIAYRSDICPDLRGLGVLGAAAFLALKRQALCLCPFGTLASMSHEGLTDWLER